LRLKWATVLRMKRASRAFTVNTTLRMITTLSQVTLNAPEYEAFSAMLRVNTSSKASSMRNRWRECKASRVSQSEKLPPFETDGANAKLLESRNQMVIEQRLNEVGQGRLLASRQTTKEEYVDSLHELGSYDVGDSPAFQVSCLYSLLLLKPSVICVS
jgi:hypothetical protein